MFGRFLLYPLATSRSTLSCAGNHRLAQWFLHYSLFMLKTISVTCLTQIVGGMRGIPWILVLLALVIFANVRGVPADAAWGEAYGGVFVGAGFQENRIVDPRGFAYWGRRGWGTDYDDADLAGGFLLGRKYELNGARFRIELDATFGDMSAQTDRVDPPGRDETARASFRWAATARLGLEHKEGPATIFINGGAAVDLAILRLAIIRRFDF